MLTIDQISDHLYKLLIPDIGKKYISRIRESQPAKSVDSGNNNNVICRYPSFKMAHTVCARSHTFMLPVLSIYEFDDDVLEYWDQPEPIKVPYKTKKGKKTSSYRYPDLLIIYREKIVLVEWLTEKDVVSRADRSPDLYTQIDGVWRSPATEDYLRDYGIEYQIRTDSEINPILFRNMDFLASYLRRKPFVSNSAQIEIKTIVKQQIGISLLDLLNAVEIATPDDIYALIAEQVIFVDLGLSPIAERAQVYLFPDPETAATYTLATKSDFLPGFEAPVFVSVEPGSNVKWNGIEWQIVNVGDNRVSLIGADDNAIELPNGTFEQLIKEGRITGCNREEQKAPKYEEGVDIFMSAGQETLSKALKKHNILRGIDDRGKTSDRTIREWQKREKFGAQMYGNKFIGLIELNQNKGNFGRKLPEPVITLMEEYIETRYEIPVQPSGKSVYIKLKIACEEAGFSPPSERTFYEEIRKRKTYTQKRKREGSRAAYNDEPFYWTLEYRTPPHGDYSFQIVHLDHTEIELKIVDSETGEVLGRLYLTLAVDAYSRRVLGYYLSFFPPSYESDMLVLREVVRRFGRFPKTIVTDRGPDFKGDDFQILLAFYGCTLKIRPKAKPRFGSIVERLFGTTQTQIFHNLKGRTGGMKSSRLNTKEIDPDRLAVWTFNVIDKRADEYFYQIYDKAEHSTLKMSPRNKFSLGKQLTGERAHDRIGYTNEFHIRTCPTPYAGGPERVVQKNKGVKILNFY